LQVSVSMSATPSAHIPNGRPPGAEAPIRETHQVSIPTRFFAPSEVGRLAPEIVDFLGARLRRAVQPRGPLRFGVCLGEGEEDALQQAIEALARELLRLPDAGVIEVSPPLPDRKAERTLSSASGLRGGDLLRALAAGERPSQSAPPEPVRPPPTPASALSVQRLLEGLEARSERLDAAAAKLAAFDLEALGQRLAQVEAAVADLGRQATHSPVADLAPVSSLQAEVSRLAGLVQGLAERGRGPDSAPDRENVLRLTSMLRLVLRELSARAEDVTQVVSDLKSLQAPASAPAPAMDAAPVAELQAEMRRLTGLVERLMERGKGAESAPDRESLLRLTATLRLVLRELNASAKDVSQAAVRLQQHSEAPAEALQGELRRLAGLVESLSERGRRPEGAPERDTLLRLTAAMRLIMRDMSARAEDMGAVVAQLKSAATIPALAPPAPAASHVPPPVMEIEPPAWRAEASQGQRLLVALGLILRRLETHTEAVGEAARQVAAKAERLEAAPVTTANESNPVLERLGSLVERLEARFEAPPAPRPMRDVSPEQEGLNRLRIGFGAALRELRAGIAEVSDAAAAVRERAQGLSGDASATGEFAALRAQIGALAEAVAELRRGPAPILLDAERSRLQKLLIGFASVLRRLDSATPTPGEGGDAAELRAELRRVALAMQAHAEQIERAGALGGGAVAEADLERVAERVAQRLQATVAESMALAMRDQGAATPPLKPQPPAHGPALERLAERVGRLHQDLALDTGKLGAALREAGGDSPQTAAVLDELKSRFAETRDFVAEVLNVAAALSRDLDKASETLPTKPAPRARGRLALR